MGRKSLRVSGYGTFGMRTMHVSFTPSFMMPVSKNSSVARTISVTQRTLARYDLITQGIRFVTYL
jgi:hypothetical protein